MMISSISVAEYCIGGDLRELPLKNLQIIPFNINHALRASKFAKIAFQAKKAETLQVNERKIIPNDTMLFAQADCEKAIRYYLSSDTESLKVYNTIKEKRMPKFQFIDLHMAHHQAFGVLDL